MSGSSRSFDDFKRSGKRSNGKPTYGGPNFFICSGLKVARPVSKEFTLRWKAYEIIQAADHVRIDSTRKNSPSFGGRLEARGPKLVVHAGLKEGYCGLALRLQGLFQLRDQIVSGSLLSLRTGPNFGPAVKIEVIDVG